MAGWSRREVLAALGMAPLLPACGGAIGRGGGAAVPLSLDATRLRLRDLVSSMQSRFPYAAALATVRRLDRATADGVENTVERAERVGVVFTAIDHSGAVHERATNDLGPDALVRAVADLLGDRQARAEIGPPESFPTLGAAIDRAGGGWLDRAQGLYERARRHGGSRVVYRAAYVDVDDTETVYVGDGRDLAQRVVRLRAGASFVAAAGATTYADAAERAGTIQLREARLTDDELAAAAEGALALLTARPAPAGDYDVLLDPSCSALLAGRCIAPALAADRWVAGDTAAADLRATLIGSEQVQLIDDPARQGGYGSYHFDDEGRRARATALIDRGVLASAYTDRDGAARAGQPPTANGRRDDPTGLPRPRPSNVYLAGGDAEGRDELIGRVESGLLLEGALAAGGDPSTWSALLRIARAREIKNGKLSGRLYGPVLLRGLVPELLAAVTAASREVHHRVGGSGVAIGGPFLLTHASVVEG